MQDENKRGCWVGGKGRVLIQDAERPLKFGINFYRSVLQFFFFFFTVGGDAWGPPIREAGSDGGPGFLS